MNRAGIVSELVFQVNHYQIRFNGCPKGAIGIHYPITAEVWAKSAEEAILKLYDDYDHISFPKWVILDTKEGE